MHHRHLFAPGKRQGRAYRTRPYANSLTRPSRPVSGYEHEHGRQQPNRWQEWPNSSLTPIRRMGVGMWLHSLCDFAINRKAIIVNDDTKVVQLKEKAPKSYDFDAFLWWARRDLNSKVFVLYPVKVRYFPLFYLVFQTFRVILCYRFPFRIIL